MKAGSRQGEARLAGTEVIGGSTLTSRNDSWSVWTLALCTFDAIGAMALPAVAAASTCSSWEWINPLPQGNRLHGAACGNGTWVVVGLAGTVLTSPDGTGPVVRDSGTSAALDGVVWTGSQFIAAGGSIVTSPDGMSWTSQTSGVTATLEAVTWGGTQYVAVDRTGTIITSPDGATWADHTQATNQTLEDVCWTGTLFVVIGTGGTIFTSPDGASWEDHSLSVGVSLWAVAWNGLELTAVTGDGQVWTSPDGDTWTEQYSPTPNQLKGMVAVGSDLWVVGDQSLILHRFERLDYGDTHGANDP